MSIGLRICFAPALRGTGRRQVLYTTLGGVLQGSVDSVMLLTRPDVLSPEANTALKANKGAIDTVTFFGGPSALSVGVRTSVVNVLK